MTETTARFETIATGPKYLPKLLLEPDELCILLSEVFKLHILLSELGALVCKLATKYLAMIC